MRQVRDQPVTLNKDLALPTRSVAQGVAANREGFFVETCRRRTVGFMSLGG